VARSKVEKVESSIKGGVVAQLGAKTLILGRNGKGKSAIVNAIELAGTGKASDVAGRDVLARDADLFMLAPPEAEKVWATVRLKGDPGGVESAAWELSKGHRAKRTGPEIAFPLRDVQEALLGSPETARKWILGVGGYFAWADVLALVPKSLHKRLAGVIAPDEAPPDAPSIGGAAAVLTLSLESAKKKVRELNATAKAARALSPPAQPPPTPQDFTAVEAVITAWHAVGDDEGAPAGDVLPRALAAAKLQVESLIQRGQALEADLAALPKQDPALELRRAAVTVADALARAQARECALCGGPTNPVDLAARAERGRQKIDEVIKREDRRRELAGQHTNLLGELAAARREVARLETEVARAEKRKKVEGERPAMDRTTAEARLRELHTLRAGWEASKRSEEQALAAERESVEWDQLSVALSTALGTLVEKSRAAFEGRVQKFLPRADLFGIDLLDGEREILRVGLRRLSGDHMVLHAALSGAEWARVTAALALATAPDSGPCVVCPEERAFDPDTLAEVLEAFDRAIEKGDPPQVIVTSPVAPAKVPAGWTVIHVGGNEEVASLKEAAPAEAKPKKGRGKVLAEFTPADGVDDDGRRHLKEKAEKPEKEEEKSKKDFDLFA
jgi:hypothetical protein